MPHDWAARPANRRSRVAERVDGEAGAGEVFCLGGLGIGPGSEASGSRSKRSLGDLHAADPVRERVMKLQYKRPPSRTSSPGGHRPLPQRPGAVEARHARDAGKVEHGRQRLRGRHLDGAEMPREIEVGVNRPPGRCEPQRRFDDAVAKTGHGAARPLRLVTQQLGVRTAVEDEHDHHGRAQQRVALHVPAERVAGSACARRGSRPSPVLPHGTVCPAPENGQCANRRELIHS